MKAYSYDYETKIFNGIIECQLDPLELEINNKEIFLLPASATFIPIISFDTTKEYLVFENEEWASKLIPNPDPVDPVDPQPSMEDQVILLRAQLQAQTDRSDFVEECIAEMATLVYV